MKHPLLTVGGSLLLLGGNLVQAADQHLETTVVTATRTETSIADSLAPVTVFDRNDIERIRPASLQELLERSVGANFVRNGARGSSTSLFLRGNQSNHVLVLVDGVRIGSATLGSPSFTNLPPELIERVEIVRGPRSSLYGSEAIAGVINIITRKFSDKQGVSALLQAGIGTQGSQKAVAAIRGGSEQTQGSLTLMHEETDGIDSTASNTGYHGDDDAFEQTAVNLSLLHRFSERASIQALYQDSQSENDYDTNCYGFDGSSYQQYDCAPFSDNQVRIGNLRADLQATDNWHLRLSVGESADQSQVDYRKLDPAAMGVVANHFDTLRRNYSIQNDIQLGKQHLLTLGFERLVDEVNSDQAYDETSRNNNARFLQWQGEAGVVNWIVGTRNDDNSQFGQHDTNNASIGVSLTREVKVIASYGEGFDAPTFNNLYYPFYGVPTLEPESSENYELGVQACYSWGGITVNRYRNKVDKLIQYNPATYGPDQIEGAEINGTEIEFYTEIADWNISANASLLDTENTLTGKQLVRRPKRQLNADVDREWQQWGVNASLRLLDSRFDDAANTDRLAGYGIVDAGISYKASATLKVQVAVRNLFDKDFVTARNFSLGDYQSIGREAMLTVTYTPEL